MNINLSTNLESDFFELRDIVNRSNEYESVLYVKSDWLEITKSFWFDSDSLIKFVTSLRAINQNLKGSAKLGYIYEPDFFEIKCDSQGHVYITGELVRHGEMRQYCEFCIETDQTVLPSLLTSFEKLITHTANN